MLLAAMLLTCRRLMMTVLDILTFTQQGVYDVVTNLCALVPRLFFLVCMSMSSVSCLSTAAHGGQLLHLLCRTA